MQSTIQSKGFWKAILRPRERYMLRPAAPLRLLSACLSGGHGCNYIRLSCGNWNARVSSGTAYIGAVGEAQRMLALEIVLYPGCDYIFEVFGKGYIDLFGEFMPSTTVQSELASIVRVILPLPKSTAKPNTSSTEKKNQAAIKKEPEETAL